MADVLRMPQITQTMVAARVAEWFRHEGDVVTKGDPLVSVETDKTLTELEAPQSGILRKILAPAGADVDVNAVLAIVGTGEEDIEPYLNAASRLESPADNPDRSSSASAGNPAPISERPAVSPRGRRLAREFGVDMSKLVGTGPGGLVTEADVRSYAEGTASLPGADGGDDEIIPLTGVRGRIAERLALSRRSAADVTTVTDVDLTELSRLRAEAGGSVTACVVKAVGCSLRQFPALNAWLIDDRIHLKKEIRIGVAVALSEGLVVPVIRSADRKSVPEISDELESLAERARSGTLGADAMTGSTFTISNSGVFGSLLFTPIINPPEVAILGMGRIAETPVVRQGQIVVRNIMLLCLSYDHRAIDGAPAVRFLQAVKSHLERPEDLLRLGST
ncbi:MAG TPA: dihydrolipoamide acetyltransferase family protein [Anaerolineales bacterium]|nr:dihydrolipoamide acetyltransferase family protein [Anaerolineales bacterium]